MFDTKQYRMPKLLDLTFFKRRYIIKKGLLFIEIWEKHLGKNSKQHFIRHSNKLLCEKWENNKIKSLYSDFAPSSFALVEIIFIPWVYRSRAIIVRVKKLSDHGQHWGHNFDPNLVFLENSLLAYVYLEHKNYRLNLIILLASVYSKISPAQFKNKAILILNLQIYCRINAN